jgi:hypothetical protein
VIDSGPARCTTALSVALAARSVDRFATSPSTSATAPVLPATDVTGADCNAELAKPSEVCTALVMSPAGMPGVGLTYFAAKSVAKPATSDSASTTTPVCPATLVTGAD